MKRAIVVGAGGQDGTLLTRSLEASGYEVLKLFRDASRIGRGPFSPPLDLGDPAGLAAAVRNFAPDEAYYLAAFHHSSQSAALAGAADLLTPSFRVNVSGLVNLLEAIRTEKPDVRLFYASSCLAFGEPDETPQNEATPMRPVCPYGVSKAAGHAVCGYYRRSLGLFACSGILYNHESELRPEGFASMRIAMGAARIKRGLACELVLGDPSALVDFGAASDFVEAMRLALAADAPRDYVVATGAARPLSDFIEPAFAALGLDWRAYVREDSSLLRRRRAVLAGDASRLCGETGWRPKIPLEELAASMAKYAYSRTGS